MSKDDDQSTFRDPPSRFAPAHDRPVPIAEPEEMQKLRALVRHWASGMKTPWNEPEYVEAMARLKELEAAAAAELKHRDDLDSDTLAAMARLTEERAELVDKINGLEGWIATLTAQRDAAVAACRSFMGRYRNHMVNARLLFWDVAAECEAVLALCAPAPVAPETPGQESDTIAEIEELRSQRNAAVAALTVFADRDNWSAEDIGDEDRHVWSWSWQGDEPIAPLAPAEFALRALCTPAPVKEQGTGDATDATCPDSLTIPPDWRLE